jgi:predicted PurR-regulated permease PerM
MSEPQLPRRDLTQVTLSVILICVMIAGTLWVLNPFITTIIWGGSIAVATWPAMIGLERRLGGSRGWAVTVMTLILLLLFVIPIVVALTAIADNIPKLQELAARIRDVGLAPAPDWLIGVPIVGERLAAGWNELSRLSQTELAARLGPYARQAIGWLVNSLQGFGLLVLQLLLVVVISAIFWAQGETAAAGIRRFLRRLAGQRGEEIVTLAGQSVRAVALGIVVTAAIQAVLGAISLLVTGVPLVGMLTAVMLLLGIAQIGAAPVMIGALIWQFSNGRTGPGIALVVLSLIVVTSDNVIRPILIRRGVDLPFLLILSGVLGGMLAFGVIGLFVGPVLLAVTYTLVSDWVKMGETVAVPATPSATPPAAATNPQS